MQGAGPDALSRNPVCRNGLMGDMHTKEARLAVLAGIRVSDDAIEEEDPAVEMVGGRLSCYVCLMFASHRVVVEVVTWERVQQVAMIDPAIQELRRLLEEGFPDTRKEMGDSVWEFFKFGEDLSMALGVIMYKDRVVNEHVKELKPELSPAPIIGTLLRIRCNWKICSEYAPNFAFLIKY